jgi:hypothetical protein
MLVALTRSRISSVRAKQLKFDDARSDAVAKATADPVRFKKGRLVHFACDPPIPQGSYLLLVYMDESAELMIFAPTQFGREETLSHVVRNGGRE